MVEGKRVFEDIKKETILNFGEIKLLYLEKTNKKGTSTVYNFIRESIDLGFLKRNDDGSFTVLVDKLRGLDKDRQND